MTIRISWLHASCVSLAVFCLIGDFLLFRTAVFNADNVQNFNELAAISHGNFILHGWSLASDNFYLTDLPFYIMGFLVAGRTPALIYIVPYFVFILFLLGCFGIVWHAGRTQSQRLLAVMAVLLLLGIPYGFPESIFLVSDVHAASIMFSVYVLLTAALYLGDPGRYPRMPLLSGGLIFIVAASDQMIDVYLSIAVTGSCVLRFWSHRRLEVYEAWLVGNIVAFSIIGTAFPFFITTHGGFALQTNFSLQFVSFIPQFFANLKAVCDDLSFLSDARVAALVGITGASLIAAAHALFLCFIVVLCLKTIWDIPVRPSRPIPQWFAMGAVTLALVDMVSQFFALQSGSYEPGLPIGAVRLVTPVYVFSVMAAIIEAQWVSSQFVKRLFPKFSCIAAAALSLLILAGAAQSFAKAAMEPAFEGNTSQIAVTQWLEDQHFTYGIGEYWTSQMITAFSEGRVKTDSVIYTTRFQAGNWVGDMADFKAGRQPQFVIFQLCDTSFRVAGTKPVGLAEITQAYGKPKVLVNVSGYIIAVLRNADQ